MSLVALTRMTVADALRQPVTWLMTVVAIGLLMLSYLFGMFNFETQDRLRMLATAGVAVSLINGLFLSVVGVSQAIHDELASRTALTLFAKPLGRGTYLVGKALGVWLTVVASCAVLAALHCGLLYVGWKTGFETFNLSSADGADPEAVVRWGAVITGHVLVLGHSAVMAAVATVLALRLALVANILACFALFVLGHLLAGFGMMGAGVVPALALFNIDDHIQLSGMLLSPLYLAATGLYMALFCAGSLVIGWALFERQDIP